MLKSQFFFHLYILMKVIVSYVIIRYLTRGIFFMCCKPSNSDSFATLHYVTLCFCHIIISIRTFFDEGL